MIVYGRTHRLWIPSPVRLFPPFSPQFSPRFLRFPFHDLSQWSPNNYKGFHSAHPTGWAESISGNGVCVYVCVYVFVFFMIRE